LYDIVYSLDVKLNIISTEKFKRENYIGYSNWIPHHLFDRATGRTIIKTNTSLRLPIISVSDAIKKDHINTLKVHYAETVVKLISLNLAHRRFNHISKPLVKMLAKGIITGLILKNNN